MFTAKNIEIAIAGTKNDLNGFVHPVWGRMEKGTGISYIPTNLIFFASGEEHDVFGTKPEEYDGIVRKFVSSCSPEQRDQIRLIILEIIEENRKNETRQHERRGEGFTHCDFNPKEEWGAAMIALREYFVDRF